MLRLGSFAVRQTPRLTSASSPRAPMNRSFLHLSLPAAALVALLASACGAADTPTGPSADAIAIQKAGDRLRGQWRLVSFQPETALEPMLQALLQMQYQTLTVHFDG